MAKGEKLPPRTIDKLGKSVRIFIVASAFIGIALGLSDSIMANYYREAYVAGAQMRGFIEFPRELPGVLSIFVIAALSALGDIRMSVIAQFLAAGGMIVLAVSHPPYGVMLLVLFIYSLGQHMYIPLGDSVGLSLARDDNMGKVLGRFNSIRMAFLMLSGVVTFFGFRLGWFGFENPILVFLLSALAFIILAGLLYWIYLLNREAEGKSRINSKFVFRREYMRYYVICALFGGRKQIMLVFSPWVLIELLDFKADTMSILSVIGSFIGIFFIPAVGKLIDAMGAKKVMMMEASAFILVYIAYGFLSKWVSGNAVALTGFWMMMVYLLNIIDRMAYQFYMTRSIYMKSIAITPEDVTPSLTLGMTIDHVVAIIGAYLCGIVWETWGPEFVFLIAGALSLLNLIAAAGIKGDFPHRAGVPAGSINGKERR